MTKNSYYSNSAKLLAILSALLFVSNFITDFSAENSSLASFGTKFAGILVYAAFILTFTAFNGEGIGNKRARFRTGRKITKGFKIYLAVMFVFRFVGGVYKKELLASSDPATPAGALKRLGFSILANVMVFSIFFFFVNLWDLFRDSSEKKLFGFEVTAFAFSLIHAVYKIFYSCITEYSLNFVGETLGGFFSDAELLNILCLLQYLVNTVVFAVVCRHYGKLAAADDEAAEKQRRETVKSRNIYDPSCIGIDDRDDIWGNTVVSVDQE